VKVSMLSRACKQKRGRIHNLLAAKAVRDSNRVDGKSKLGYNIDVDTGNLWSNLKGKRLPRAEKRVHEGRFLIPLRWIET
jgi:hypothetical protein